MEAHREPGTVGQTGPTLITPMAVPPGNQTLVEDSLLSEENWSMCRTNHTTVHVPDPAHPDLSGFQPKGQFAPKDWNMPNQEHLGKRRRRQRRRV